MIKFVEVTRKFTLISTLHTDSIAPHVPVFSPNRSIRICTAESVFLKISLCDYSEQWKIQLTFFLRNRAALSQQKDANRFGRIKHWIFSIYIYIGRGKYCVFVPSRQGHTRQSDAICEAERKVVNAAVSDLICELVNIWGVFIPSRPMYQRTQSKKKTSRFFFYVMFPISRNYLRVGQLSQSLLSQFHQYLTKRHH